MSDNNSCCTCIISTFCALSGILFLGMVVSPLINSLDFEETQCYVNYTQIPNTLPNETCNENWVHCDCGRRCNFETACAQIFVTIENSSTPVLLLPSTISWYNNGTSCTYSNKRCENNIVYMIQSMQLAKNQVEPYEQYKNEKEPITCYVNSQGENAYLSNELLLKDYLPYSIMLGIGILLFFCLIYFIKCKKD
ncbi:hypothetical protein CPAV1605_223 [seawater metagenome]|uniref:Uncharacterized protein n=1 Tax=seawater metagenome TaxID=1561972 RepID=A0A5E8CH32_9ZZZZ